MSLQRQILPAGLNHNPYRTMIGQSRSVDNVVANGFLPFECRQTDSPVSPSSKRIEGGEGSTLFSP